MKSPIYVLLSLFVSTSVYSQSLADAFKPQAWATLIFVSTKMPRESLVALAKEASKSNATLVLNGFGDGRLGPQDMQRYVSDINAACCNKDPVAWLIHPKLFERYRVKATPTFVLAYGSGANDADFASVAGDMSLANALKFIAQESRSTILRTRAQTVYQTAYSRE